MKKIAAYDIDETNEINEKSPQENGQVRPAEPREYENNSAHGSEPNTRIEQRRESGKQMDRE